MAELRETQRMLAHNYQQKREDWLPPDRRFNRFIQEQQQINDQPGVTADQSKLGDCHRKVRCNNRMVGADHHVSIG